jgi:tricorn protease-like protein
VRRRPVAVSPDRAWAAVFFGLGNYSTHITMFDPAGRPQTFAPTAAPALYQNWPRFSSDGQWLYYSARAVSGMAAA